MKVIPNPEDKLLIKFLKGHLALVSNQPYCFNELAFFFGGKEIGNLTGVK